MCVAGQRLLTAPVCTHFASSEVTWTTQMAPMPECELSRPEREMSADVAAWTDEHQGQNGGLRFMSWLLYHHQPLTHSARCTLAFSQHTPHHQSTKARINHNPIITSSYMATVQYRSHAIVSHRDASENRKGGTSAQKAPRECENRNQVAPPSNAIRDVLQRSTKCNLLVRRADQHGGLLLLGDAPFRD
jgi:hypothetical protein